MDKSIVEQGLSNTISKLETEDTKSKEYSQLVNNATKLQGMLINDEELELKKSRAIVDEALRREELGLNEKKLKFEKTKFEADQEEKKLDREVEIQRMNNQHEEKMAEIEVNRIKAINEKTILEQNQVKADREFKANRRRDWLIFGGKALLFGTSIVLSVCMHKDELRFERDENGIIPKPCKTYDDTVTKMSEMIMK